MRPAAALSTGPLRPWRRPVYRRAMFSFSLMLADSDVVSARATAPTSVPPTWTGAASTACQVSLDTLATRVSALGCLLDEARAAVDKVDDFGVCAPGGGS